VPDLWGSGLIISSRHYLDYLTYGGGETAVEAVPDFGYHVGLLGRAYGDVQVCAGEFFVYFVLVAVVEDAVNSQDCRDICGPV
jgi:hypothetical protein